MKKFNLSDKINIGIIAFNFVCFIIWFFVRGAYELPVIIMAVMLYAIFGVPIVIMVGTIMDIVSLIVKIRGKTSIKWNLVILLSHIISGFIWWGFFYDALMGV